MVGATNRSMAAMSGAWLRRKVRHPGEGAQIDADLRALIRRMSADNPLWGAPRIHGELPKLGLEVAQSSVAKYMVKRCEPPGRRPTAGSSLLLQCLCVEARSERAQGDCPCRPRA